MTIDHFKELREHNKTLTMTGSRAGARLRIVNPTSSAGVFKTDRGTPLHFPKSPNFTLANFLLLQTADADRPAEGVIVHIN